jgi:DNA-binding response OmpR family regulator
MNTFSFGHGVVDLVRAEVIYHDGQRCALSQREVSVLTYLISKPGVPVTRDELLAEVWKINPTNVLTRTIDMHMSNLRRKLRDNARKPVVLKTVNRHGYMLASSTRLRR